MNTVRKLLELNYQEVKYALDQAYHRIEVFQANREDQDVEQQMRQGIMDATQLLAMFKPYTPLYKQKYFEILEHHATLHLSPRDLVMAFDRMVYELHTRLEKRLSDAKDFQAWSPLMKEILDGRREIPQKNNDKSQESNVEFIASGLTVVSGYVDSSIQIVCGAEDLEKVQPGDILISRMTTPEIIMVIDKISSIATEQGGQFCHAAIIAREYNIPCLVGCGDFIHTLKDRETLIFDGLTGILCRRI